MVCFILSIDYARTYQNCRYSSESLTRAQALKGMTLDPAYASFSERDIGSLQKGKKADLVVLNQNIMEIDMSEVLTTKVEATVIDGKLLYGSLGQRRIKLRVFMWRVLQKIQSRFG
jgi:predicted amidohydrolase YtcJ